MLHEMALYKYVGSSFILLMALLNILLDYDNPVGTAMALYNYVGHFCFSSYLFFWDIVYLYEK